MVRRSLACWALLWLGGHAQGATPQWQITWQSLGVVAEVPGFVAPAMWRAELSGQRTLALPMAVQVDAVLAKSGQRVRKGQPLLRLSGQALLNFAIELELAVEHEKAARERIRRNESRYAQGDITRATWLEWQHEVHQTQMAARMRMQQQQLLQSWLATPTAQGYEIAAPMDAVLVWPHEFQRGDMLSENSTVLQLLPSSDLQLELTLPLQQGQAVAVQVGDCRLPLTMPAAQSEGQRQMFRTDALNLASLSAACQQEPRLTSRLLGQRISVVPLYTQTALKLPLSSLVQHDAGDAVLVNPQQPQLVPVRVLARDEAFIYIEPTAQLQGQAVAQGDVAALKGVLAGLGGEA